MDIKKILNKDNYNNTEAKTGGSENSQPKKPMTKKDKIINIVGWIIIILVVVKGCGFMFSDDDKAVDTDTSTAEIQEENEADETRDETESQKTPMEEAAEAEERKVKVEELSTEITFEGMDADYIDCTSCGAHDYDEDDDDGEYDLLCYWRTRDTSALDRSWFQRAYIKDGKVIEIQHRDYWNEDGSLDINKVLEDRKDNTKLLSGDTEVDNAWTGKEYADSHFETYLEEINADDKYQAIDNDSKEAIAWCKALDYWLEKKEAEHFLMEQYHETVMNSKK